MTIAVDPYAFLQRHQRRRRSDAKSNQQLGQNEFLKLMLAQLKNQDPFKPMDPTQFLSQLAQFSTGDRHPGHAGRRSTTLVGLAALHAGAERHDARRPRRARAARQRTRIAAGGTVNGAVDVPEGRVRAAGHVTDAQRRARAALRMTRRRQRPAGIHLGRHRQRRHARARRQLHLRSDRQRRRPDRARSIRCSRAASQRHHRPDERLTHSEHQHSARVALADVRRVM